MSARELVSGLAAVSGVVFYCAGTLGLLRFPDLYTRLHALTKADNVGVGLLALSLAIVAETWSEIASLALLWLIAMAASAASAQVVARGARRSGLLPWQGPQP